MSEKDLPVKASEKLPERRYTSQDLAALRSTVTKGATDEEIHYFIQYCRARQLDPFAGQVHFVKRQDGVSFQMGVHGKRAVAERTKRHMGEDDPLWYDDRTREWVSFWDRDYHPYAAKVVIYKLMPDNQVKPITGIAKWNEYYPGDTKGFMYNKMPSFMLAKDAASQAYQRGYPELLGGIYDEGEVMLIEGNEQRQEELSTPQGPGFVKKPEPAPAQEVPAPAKATPALLFFWQKIPKEIKKDVEKFKGKSIPVANARGVFFDRLRHLDPPMTEEEAKYLAAQFYGIKEVDVSFGDKNLDLDVAKEKFETLWAIIMYQVDKEAKAEADKPQEPHVVTNQVEFNKFTAWMHELIPPSHNLYGEIHGTLFPSGKKLPKYIERVKAALVLLMMNGVNIPEDNPIHKWLQERGL